MSDDDDFVAARIRKVIETVGSAVPDPSDSHLAPPVRSHPGSHRRWAMAAAVMLVVGGIAALLHAAMTRTRPHRIQRARSRQQASTPMSRRPRQQSQPPLVERAT